MTLRDGTRILFASLLLALFMTAPVYGIVHSTSVNGVGMSERLSLSDSTSFKATTLISESNIFHDLDLKGSDDNSIQNQLSGDGIAVTNTLVSSGPLKTSASLEASEDSAIIIQSNQQTGDACFMSTDATSRNNEMRVAGGYAGEGGDLKTNFVSAVGERAWINGEGSSAGVEGVNSEALQYIGSADMAGAGSGITGLFLTEKGDVGDYGFTAVNMNTKTNAKKSVSKTGGKTNAIIGTGTHPETTIAGGNSNNYVYPREIYSWFPTTGNAYWEIASPMSYYLRTDKKLTGEGLNTANVKQALSDAMESWDYWADDELFSGISGSGTSYAADRMDGHNVIAWTSCDVNSLAYNSFRFHSDGDDKWTIDESDIVLNTNWGWTTDWYTANHQTWKGRTQLYKLDVQTVALHELGHSVGLGDLYLLSDSRKGGSEIMNSYSKPQHNLGAGDIAGLQSIYGIYTPPN